MLKVMIVDDDSMVFHIVKKTIPWEKYQMSVEAYAPNGLKAIQYLVENPVDVLFVDLSMPHMGGIELIRRIHEYLPHTVFVILSSHSEYRFVKESFCIGAFDYLLKVDIDDDAVVDELLTRVTDKLSAMKWDAERRFDLGDIISKLDPGDAKKEEFYYQVWVMKFKPDMNRLKVAEELHRIAEEEEMVYGCYEGNLVLLCYAKEKAMAEKASMSIHDRLLRETDGIAASGTSACGAYRDIEELYIEAVRNMDNGFLQIKEYLMENYHESQLSLQSVADDLNISQRTVSKYIAEGTGLMFKAYLNEIRIQMAKEKLRSTNMRIQEVAYASGYTNVEHFTRIFTEKAGCSPSQYAAHKKAGDTDISTGYRKHK